MAAAKGKILVVAALWSIGADDVLLAPDGQLALRLTAEARHGEIAAYLLSRRIEEWKR